MLVSGRVFYINKFPKNSLKASSLHHQGSPALQVCWVSRPQALDDFAGGKQKQTSQVPTIPPKKTWMLNNSVLPNFKKSPLGYVLIPSMFFFRMEWRLKWLGITPQTQPMAESGPGWRFSSPSARVTVRRWAAPKRPFQSYGPRSLLMKRRRAVGEVVHKEGFFYVFLGLEMRNLGKLKVDTAYDYYHSSLSQ